MDSARPRPALSSAAMRSRSSAAAVTASDSRAAFTSSIRSIILVRPYTTSEISTMLITGSRGPSSAALATTAGANGQSGVSSSEPPTKPRMPTEEPNTSTDPYARTA
ncbi:hypothetical protein ACWGH8_37270 [Nonomuraea muscovyensis]